uniref:ZP domain-containing protein n=1 Tax=Anopheles dirus TaxID=7168 RepID=A0A182NL86_9DIPT
MKCTFHFQISFTLLSTHQKEEDQMGPGSVGRTEERSVQLAVRVHKTLELADDKFYVITCGKTGFARDDSGAVALKFLDSTGRRVRETVYNREYTIKAEVTNPNGTYGIRVKNCFAFNKKNMSVALIDERGCPLKNDTMTRFRASADGTSATAQIMSMFKFSEGSEVHFQCDVVQCNGRCPELDESICTGDANAFVKSARALGQVDDGMLLAATTVFVIDPAFAPVISAICDDTGIRPHWLLWLTIALGVLFLIMLLMNIFLCTAMSCSCAQTEIIEKEPSIIEEYDPYRSWHGSQYGSRYSLHGGREGGHNKGYTSGGSTIHSNRSLPIDSDHYAIVHSRPGSRHSGLHGHRPRGPPSNM